jgi:hypothetical protein
MAESVKIDTYQIGVRGIKNFILGKYNPSVYTQIVLILSILYFFWWIARYSINLIAIQMIEVLPKTEKINNLFNTVGERYAIDNLKDTYFTVCIIELCCAGLFLTAIILLWRSYKLGYYLLYISFIISLPTIYFWLGMDFINNEQSRFEYIIPLILMALYIIDAIFFYKPKNIHHN